MRTGFWLCGDECFDCLADTGVGDAYGLLHGFCHVFAAALNARFGYRTYGAYTFDEESEQSSLVHMFCLAPEGEFVDVRGIADDWYEFMEAFEDEFSDLDDDVYIDDTDIAGFDSGAEYELALALIDAYPEYYSYCP